MSPERNPDLAAAEAALFEADRELGRRAFEIVIAPRFPEYTELVHVGVRRDEPQLIYRGGDQFLVVDTAISDPLQEAPSAPVRVLADGRTAQRGTREYLMAVFQNVPQTVVDQALALELMAALLANRVRHILVMVDIAGAAGQREVESVTLGEFDV